MRVLSLLAALTALAGCSPEPDPAAGPPEEGGGAARPEWIARAVVAGLPVGEATPERTFRAVADGLGALRAAGITVLWLPGLADSTAAASVAASLGTDDDFRALVDAAHAEGLYVLVDCPVREADSAAVSADALAARFRAWVERFDVDGFRCEGAEALPPEVWRPALAALREAKPVLMLAAGRAPWLYDAGFDVVEGQDVHRALRAVWGGAPADTLYAALAREGAADPPGHLHLRYLTAPGAEGEGAYGSDAGRQAATAVVATLPGVLYVALGADGDSLSLKALGELTPGGEGGGARAVLGLRRSSRALREGAFEPVAVEADGVLAYARVAGAERVVVVVNARAARRAVALPDGTLGAAMQDVLTGEPAPETLTLEPHGVRLFRGLSTRDG